MKVAVMTLDGTFLKEFGYRRAAPGGLVAPNGIAILGGDTVCVAQRARRGVSVYRVQAE